MALSTYSDLQTAVASWMHRADLAAIIPDLILVAEKRIFRDIRTRDMETALSATISSGVIAVPADYLDMKFAYVDGNPVQALQRATGNQVYHQYPIRTPSGKPVYIAREGANFIFGPYPDSAYTIKGIYYAEPTSIQATANAVFVANPDLYLYASLVEAASYVDDEALIVKYEGKYQQAKVMVEKQENEYGSGGGLEIVAA